MSSADEVTASDAQAFDEQVRLLLLVSRIPVRQCALGPVRQEGLLTRWRDFGQPRYI